MGLLVVLGILVVAAAGVGAAYFLTQDDNGDRDGYIDAVAFLVQDGSDLSESEARCLAETTVDVVGVDALEEVATPEEIRDNPDRSLTDHGIEIDSGQGSDFFDGMVGCLDVRQRFIDGFADDFDQSVADCVDAAVDDDLFRRVAVASFVDEDWTESEPDLAEEFRGTIAHCEP